MQPCLPRMGLLRMRRDFENQTLSSDSGRGRSSGGEGQRTRKQLCVREGYSGGGRGARGSACVSRSVCVRQSEMLSPPRTTQSPDCSWVGSGQPGCAVQHPSLQKTPASQVSYFPRGSSSKGGWSLGEDLPRPQGQHLAPTLPVFPVINHPTPHPCSTHKHTHHQQGARNTGVGGWRCSSPPPPAPPPPRSGQDSWVFTGASARGLVAASNWAPEIAFPPGLHRRGRGSPALATDT